MAEAIAEYMRHHKAQMLTNILILIKKSIFRSMTSDLISTLAQARKAARITQADLAARAGLSRMAVQRTETGDVDPRFSTLQEMARVLEMDLIAVPSALRAELQAFIQSGGKFLAQPEGADAPPSIVDKL